MMSLILVCVIVYLLVAASSEKADSIMELNDSVK
ncbi:cbb3-type cytochrome oxidase subunit 3 [Paenibacillus brasilensis]|uniref:Cbb3-type cytochrome oxidase subunit 3 n=1 Tax=Paenibacillus brasilensis TaxID=128574 RepID=A0ABU0L3J1_9BACL|nr:cbb3-type cytochrome oxidase subunit 3 [Paenibacillus brasilensis]